MVKVGGEWYGVDCTADNGSTIDRDHFLMGRSTMRQYATDRLDPLSIFGKSHTIAANDYQAAPKPPVTTKKTTFTSHAAAATAAVAASTTESSARETTGSLTSTPSTENRVPMMVTDEKTGISVEAGEGMLPPDTRLVATPADYVLADVAGKFIAFDISLENDSGKIQPDGKVQVSIPIPDGYDKGRLTVYHVADGGAQIEISCTVSGNTVAFTADHFSLYVVAEKAAVQSTGGNLVLWVVLGTILAAVAAGAALWWFKFRRKTLSLQ